MTGWAVLSLSLLCLTNAAKLPPAADKAKPSPVELMMPSVQPKEANTYLCQAIKVNKTMYITGFKPKAEMSVAHHMLIFGCAEPGGEIDKPWDCGEMHHPSASYRRGPVCKRSESIIYAWGMGAPPLALPKQVAFKVGGETGVTYLVLQVHYKDVSNFLPPKNNRDSSGVVLKTTTVPQPKLAGVYLLGTDGVVPAHSTTYMETACSYDESSTLYPFAFRAHAHQHGKVVAGYRVRDGLWTEIGRISPQLEQMFYPVTTSGIDIVKADVLAARCTMVNDEDVDISIGSTTEDEMCNFYVMYYVNGDTDIQDKLCFSPGPPTWSWMNYNGIHAERAPRNASVIPDTDKVLEETRQQIQQVESDIDQQVSDSQLLEDALFPLRKNDWRDDELYGGADVIRPSPQRFPWNDDTSYLYPLPPGYHHRMRDEELDPKTLGLLASLLGDDAERTEIFDERVDTNRLEAEIDGGQQRPLKTETVSLIKGKDGGKGYEKTKNLFKQLNVPGGRGFYKESRKESGYTWGGQPISGEEQKQNENDYIMN